MHQDRLAEIDHIFIGGAEVDDLQRAMQAAADRCARRRPHPHLWVPVRVRVHERLRRLPHVSNGLCRTAILHARLWAERIVRADGARCVQKGRADPSRGAGRGGHTSRSRNLRDVSAWRLRGRRRHLRDQAASDDAVLHPASCPPVPLQGASGQAAPNLRKVPAPDERAMVCRHEEDDDRLLPQTDHSGFRESRLDHDLIHRRRRCGLLSQKGSSQKRRPRGRHEGMQTPLWAHTRTYVLQSALLVRRMPLLAPGREFWRH